MTFDEGAALAAEYGVQFFEVSAKSNINVTEAFQAAVDELYEREPKKGISSQHKQ